MPQTNPTDGHAHWYTKGNLHTDMTLDHWHTFIPGRTETGPAIMKGHMEAEPDGHTHTIDDPHEGFQRA